MQKIRSYLKLVKTHLWPRGHTEQFHSYELSGKEADQLEAEVIRESGFIPETGDDARIFEGRIYKAGKVATRITKGTDKEGRSATLKVQFLQPPREEAENMRDFERYKDPQSSIRTAEIYEHQPYSEEKRYGWVVMEHVEGAPVFEGLASEEEMDEWIRVYADYRRNCLKQPFFEPKWYEKPGRARAATGLRMANWLKISLTEGHLNGEKIGLAARHQLRMTLDGTSRISFTHGHFSNNDLLVTETGEAVLFSQGFYKYLPEYYDSTFQIWASLKDLRGDDIPKPEETEKVIDYTERWRAKYKTLNFIQNDPEFDQYFASNMRERALGALIVDIDNDVTEGKMNEEDAEKLKAIFRALYQFYSRPEWSGNYS